MPTNYLPGDIIIKTHFIPAVLKKDLAKLFKKDKLNYGALETKQFIDDLADPVLFFMNKKIKHNLINIGSQKKIYKSNRKILLKF